MSAIEDEVGIDIAEPLSEICARLGLDKTYVASIEIRPGDVSVVLYRGLDGRCKGSKFVNEKGDAATETLDVKVVT